MSSLALFARRLQCQAHLQWRYELQCLRSQSFLSLPLQRLSTATRFSLRCFKAKSTATTASTSNRKTSCANLQSSTSTLSTAPLPHHIIHTADGLYIDTSLPFNFNKILIANRGEIACRIIRTCRQLDVKTVCVFSEADANSQHVEMADEAYQIGAGSLASQTYLLSQSIIEIAVKSGSEAIHPGYGFLSENAEFSQACATAGIVFIGPPAQAITSMGSKSASKAIMIAADVPVVPGYFNDEQQDTQHLCAEAEKLGFPLMLKGVSGGGGKGMRIVRHIDELTEAIETCKRESLNSFKDARILMERYIERPRHIEFQIFADQHGKCVYLWERDCSVQRRHQKVLEECPAPHLTAQQRREMGESAVRAALAVKYVGAGTVEFIVDTDTNQYYFMEMNTRLQVEHPITEMIMRRDLVQWQLHTAKGYKLPVTDQSQICVYGHAIEARIYAESPYNNFLPAVGKLQHLQMPQLSASLRVESGVRQGDEVSVYYDPMISKLCVHGMDRQQAIQRMLNALSQYHIVGLVNNVEFLKRCLIHPIYREGKLNTTFIAKHSKDLLPVIEAKPESVSLSLAVSSLLLAEQRQQHRSTDPHSAWSKVNHWRLNDPNTARTMQLIATGYNEAGETVEKQFEVKIVYDAKENGKFKLFLPQASTPIQVLAKSAPDSTTHLSAHIDDTYVSASVVCHQNEFHVFQPNAPTRVYKLHVQEFNAAASSADKATVAPMSGRIVAVQAKEGQQVKKGQVLLVMEAMKMQISIKAPADAVLKRLPYKVGDVVQGGKVLVEYNQDENKQ